MTRRIAVALDLEAQKYISEAMTAKKETSSLNHEMDQLNRAVDKVERDMAELAGTAAVAARQVDNLGDQSRQAATSMSALDARIKATRLSVRELGLEFARTGDAADGRAFNQEKSLLSRLERLKKTLQGITPEGGVPDIPRVAAGAGGIGRITFTNPYLLAGAAALVAAAAPGIGAVIGGLLAGSIGTVGVVGGLVAAAHDPRVKTEAAYVGDVIAAEFFRTGDAFVEPALSGLNIVRDAFLGLKLPETFAKVAPSVEIIAHGIAALATNTMPGLNKAFSRMTPYANAAAQGFSNMGSSLSRFLDDVTASPGTLEGLKFAFNLTNNAIVILGASIKFLSNEFHNFMFVLHDISGGLGQFLTGPLGSVVLAWLHKTTGELMGVDNAAGAAGIAVAHAAAGVGVFGEAADGAATATAMLNTQLNRVYETFLLLEGDEVAVEAGIDALSDSMERNGTTLDKATAAGRENVTNLISIAQNARDTISDMIAHGRSVEEVNAKYNQFRQELYDTFIQAGKTAAEAQALVDKWLGLEALKDIEMNVTIHQRTYRTTYGPAPDVSWGGGLQEFAAGGMVQGPPGSAQMILAHAGEQVLTQQQQAQQWNGGGSYGGGGTMTHRVDLVLNGRTIKEIMISDATGRNVSPVEIRAAYP